jgi:hypothetical protein
MPESDRERRGHRIRVSQKKSDEAVLIQQIQLLALNRGKTVPADRIRELLPQLLDTVCLWTDRLWPSQFWGDPQRNIIHLASHSPVNKSVNKV